MNRSEIARRDFLRKVAVATMGITFEGTNVGSAASGSVRIEEPFHGAVLNRRHGKQVNDGLEIQVSGTAPLRDRVTVNGTPAQRAGARFTSKVVLRQNQTDIMSTKPLIDRLLRAVPRTTRLCFWSRCFDGLSFAWRCSRKTRCTSVLV